MTQEEKDAFNAKRADEIAARVAGSIYAIHAQHAYEFSIAKVAENSYALALALLKERAKIHAEVYQ